MYDDSAPIGDIPPQGEDPLLEHINKIRKSIIDRMLDKDKAHQYYDDLIDVVNVNSDAAYHFCESLTYLLCGGDFISEEQRLKKLRYAYKKCLDSWADFQVEKELS